MLVSTVGSDAPGDTAEDPHRAIALAALLVVALVTKTVWRLHLLSFPGRESAGGCAPLPDTVFRWGLSTSHDPCKCTATGESTILGRHGGPRDQRVLHCPSSKREGGELQDVRSTSTGTRDTGAPAWGHRSDVYLVESGLIIREALA